MTDQGVHPEAVFIWRKERFAKLGFTKAQVAYLASHRVDLTQAEGLLVQGCPHDLVVRILADTTVFGEDDTDYAALAVVAVTGA